MDRRLGAASAAVLAASAALALSVQAQAATAAAKNDPRDFSGVWDTTQGLMFDPATAEPKGATAQGPGDRERPPYKPEWEAKYEAKLVDSRKGIIIDPLNFCVPHGMPRILGGAPGPLEILQTPTRINIQWEYFSQTHRIYMNVPHSPPNEVLTAVMGEAVGHWEGNTLVVDTIGMKAGVFDRTQAPYSDQIHVVERITKTDPNTLKNEITIEDPVALTRPWHVTRIWTRAEPGVRVGDLFCDSDRNPVVNGQVQVVLDSGVLPPGTAEHDAAALKAAADSAAATAAQKK
jgi:hypothetical protein